MKRKGSGKYAHIYNNRDALLKIVDGCASARHVLEKMHASISSASYKALRRACQKHNITIPSGRLDFCRRNGARMREEADARIWERLIDGESYGSTSLRNRILRLGILPNVCASCGLRDTWNGLPLVLELDHINGRHRDWRLENIRMLCPNCHSQTIPSRTGNHAQKQRIPKIPKPPRVYKRKFDPSRELLEQMLWTKPTTAIAQVFGVTDSAVGRRCRLMGLAKPPRGYWTKVVPRPGVDPGSRR